jgi:hypothetical protein
MHVHLASLTPALVAAAAGALAGIIAIARARQLQPVRVRPSRGRRDRRR